MCQSPSAGLLHKLSLLLLHVQAAKGTDYILKDPRALPASPNRNAQNALICLVGNEMSCTYIKKKMVKV